MKYGKFLFIITIVYFVLGIINIHFALLGILCMGIPLVLLFKNRKKTWCQKYCPRAKLYTVCGKAACKYSRKTPTFFVKGPMKWIMLTYFMFSLTNIIISTVAVANGKPAGEAVKFLFLLKLPYFPQVFSFDSIPWIVNLSYGFYSMMFTTTVLGLILALIFKPRTWCTICPISTVSDVYIKKTKS